MAALHIVYALYTDNFQLTSLQSPFTAITVLLIQTDN